MAAALSALLVRESSLLTSGFTRIVYKLIVPWPGSAVGKKMGKNGEERHKKITCTLFPSPLTRLARQCFFFSLLNFPPAAEPGPRLTWSLCKIWFCTDIILYFKNPLPLPLPTLTHNVSITNKNKQRSCTSCQVCKIPARIIQLYKDIHYFQFDFPCFLLFIYCLDVRLCSFKWNWQR